MKPLTDLLDKGKELREKSTSGPWELLEDCWGERTVGIGTSFSRNGIRYMVAVNQYLKSRSESKAKLVNDFGFIVHSRNTHEALEQIVRVAVEALELIKDKMPRCECVDGHNMANEALKKMHSIAEKAGE